MAGRKASRRETGTGAVTRSQDLVVRLGSALHRFGAPAHRLELALEQVSRSLSLDAGFLSTPTSLLCAFVNQGQRVTTLARLEVGSVDLARLGELDELAGDVAAGRLDVEHAFRRLQQIEEGGRRYGALARSLAAAVATSTAAVLLGGGGPEVVLALVAGALVGGLTELGASAQRFGRLLPVAGAFSVALLCGLVQAELDSLGAFWEAGFSVPLVLVASLITLVPGLAVTVSVSELAQGSLVSGSSRLFGAMLIFLMLGFGVALGSGAGGLDLVDRIIVPAPLWLLVIAAVLSGLSFVAIFNAAPRDIAWILAIGLVTFLVTRASTDRLGLELGTFAGAFAVGVCSNGFSRVTGRPAMIPRVPAVFLLVPGALGFRSVSSLLQQDALSGVQLAFTVGLVAVAIVTGLLVANVLLRPRWEL